MRGGLHKSSRAVSSRADGEDQSQSGFSLSSASAPYSAEMEVLRFILLLLVAVLAQVYTAVLGSPLSSEVDGEMLWSPDDWQQVGCWRLTHFKFIIDFTK